MTSKRYSHLPVLFVALLTFTSCDHLFKPPAPPSKSERQKEFVSCFRQEFDPTDQQLEILEKRIFSNTFEVEQIANQLKITTQELERHLESDTSDAEVLDDFHKVGVLKQKMSEDHFRRMLALRAILTSSQRKKFLACKRKLGPSVLPHE
jgi:hypothetical protein